MDKYREGLVEVIGALERGIAAREERLAFLRRQLTEYDSRGFRVRDFDGMFPRDAVMVLLGAEGEMRVDEAIAALIDGGVKVGEGRPETNIRMALTILVKSGKLWLNGSPSEGRDVSVQDGDRLGLPRAEK